jgi:hypothetical protein
MPPVGAGFHPGACWRLTLRGAWQLASVVAEDLQTRDSRYHRYGQKLNTEENYKNGHFLRSSDEALMLFRTLTSAGAPSSERDVSRFLRQRVRGVVGFVTRNRISPPLTWDSDSSAFG